MPFQLQILHASDLEAGIPALTDAVNFSTVVNALRDDYANTLILSSGDNYIPGPFFSAAADPSLNSLLGGAGTAAPGRADIAIMNEIGFQAAAFGNHEFDLGTSAIATAIVPVTTPATSSAYQGARFPYLSSNLDFDGNTALGVTADPNLGSRVVRDGQDFTTIGSTQSVVLPNGTTTTDNRGRIARSAVLTVGGERIGIVGATTPTLPTISSPGSNVIVTPQPFAGNPTPAQLDALAAEIQTAVNGLVSTGINKIVLLAHMQQIGIERELAKRLTNVDVVIAGGSNTLLADSTDPLRPGDTAAGTYPLVETNPTGQQVLVVNTDGNYRYVGRLVATFDDSGLIDPASLDPTINGAYATDAANVAALTATNPGTPDPEVVAITSAIQNVIVSKDSVITGKTTVFLNGTRNDVRTQETNLGDITADANLFIAKQVDPTVTISLKNGGGIRDNIGEVQSAPGATDPNAVIKLPPQANPLTGKQTGDVSQLDIENSLRFNNALSLITITATQLKQVLEHGVSGIRPGQTPGGFPQVGGMSFNFDPNRTAQVIAADGTITTPGQRIRSLAITAENGNVTDVVVDNGAVVGDPNRTFRMVALNFNLGSSNLTSSGDGYPFWKFVLDNPTLANRVDFTGEGTLDFNRNGRIDGPLNLPVGNFTFAAPGTEQDAFAEYMGAKFSTTPYSTADVASAFDTRIRNLALDVNGTPGRDTLVGTADSNRLIGGFGGDTLTGGAGDDAFVYTNIRDAGDRITDFTIGSDKIVLTQLLDSIVPGGYSGTNAIADGYVSFATSGSSTILLIDQDGTGTAAVPRAFLTVGNIALAALNTPTNFVF
jgi:2',3'-cyclic-nucleotide 2'-phosphodiesterase (5'-nucleotidase family)